MLPSRGVVHLNSLWTPSLGAIPLEHDRCLFRVWAHDADSVEVHLQDERIIPMTRDAQGYYQAIIENVAPGTLYFYRLNGSTDRPDPASRFQPQSVHGPSQVVRRDFAWSDDRWSGLPLEEYIFYELHVGAFTPEGTFAAIIPHLDELVDLGNTAVELMPVAQFPGERNWGYDGVGLFAVQNSYGGPDGLKQLVNECHRRGLAVVLDVVYNHLGAEGNYLHDYGPYFTDRYKTPWGDSLNFDGPYSDHVRHFFIENALYWINEFHIDALRLDATHALFDFSAYTFLEELVETVHEQAERLNRRIYLIAENDRSDDRLLRPAALGGFGLDAQWSDDLHHILHSLLTDEHFGYYQDFSDFHQLVKAEHYGFVYSGGYSAFRQRYHGTFAADLPAYRFVVCSQNHDQVGNRMKGERLSQLVSFEALKVAAGLVLLSPYLPLLFMGEEYGEPAPFLSFTSHTDPALGAAVSQGRKDEFKAYNWEGEAPDPQAEDTFRQSKLNHALRCEGQHAQLLNFYTELIRLRKTCPALRQHDKKQMEVVGYDRSKVLFVHRWHKQDAAFLLFNLNDQPVSITPPIPARLWRQRLNSAQWAAPDAAGQDVTPIEIGPEGEVSLTLPPHSFVLYTAAGQQ
jgi:maltooligosyltrehalose trehalohydrolase